MSTSMARTPSALPLGLALGKAIAVGDIQTHHRSILLRLNQCLDLQRDLVRCVGDAQFPVGDRVATLVSFAQRLAVHAQGHQLHAVAQQLSFATSSK